MKNKKIIAFLILITPILFTKCLFAQKNYFSFNVGYGLKMSAQNIEGISNSSSNYNNGTSSSTDEQINLSLGQGLNFGCNFEHMFNNNIGVDLAISYLLGGKTSATDSYSSNFNGSNHTETSDLSISSNMIRIIPSLVLTSGLEKINPYAKFGIVIASGSIVYDINSNDDGDILVRKIKLNGGMAFGLNSGVGVIFKQSDKMSFFGELNMVNLSYAPNKGELTESTENGVDNLPTMTTYEKEIEFVDIITYNGSVIPSESQPSQALKQKYPFGSFGLNFGIKIGL